MTSYSVDEAFVVCVAFLDSNLDTVQIAISRNTIVACEGFFQNGRVQKYVQASTM